MEVMSVFLTPPLIHVLHGRRELGLVDQSSFMPRAKDRPIILSLGGRAWIVRSIDWPRGTAYVEPAADAGRSKWKSLGPGLSFAMCRRVRDLLATDIEREWWSRRAKDAMTAARAEYPWLTTNGTAVLTEPNGDLMWWTFAGRSVNATLATALQTCITGKVAHDNFAVKMEAGSSTTDLEACIATVRGRPRDELLPEIDADAVTALKFSDCMPPERAQRMLQRRATDYQSLATVLNEPVRFVAAID